MSEQASIPTVAPSDKTTRRDFLYIATAAFGAVGVAASLVPFISQMDPDASTLAAGGPIELDLGNVAPGQQVVLRWRDRPVFVTHRTPKVLQMLKDPTLLAQLADPRSSELQQPPYAENWHRSIKPEFGVIIGICTHLGCIPEFEPQPNATQPHGIGRAAISVRATAPNMILQVGCFGGSRRPSISRSRPIIS